MRLIHKSLANIDFYDALNAWHIWHCEGRRTKNNGLITYMNVIYVLTLIVVHCSGDKGISITNS
jgi:hypothetical protein